MQGNLNSSQVKVIKKNMLWNVVVVGGVTIVLFTIDFYFCVSQRHITHIEIFNILLY